MRQVPSGRPIRMAILSRPEHLPVVRAAAGKICEMVGFDDQTADGVVLSVDEALSNVIRHAYRGAPDKRIEVEFEPLGRRRPKGLRIRLRDYGRTVAASQIRPRDLSEVRPGGLGVHIMNRCMDRVEYRHPRGGGTLLTMVKNLCPGTKGP